MTKCIFSLFAALLLSEFSTISCIADKSGDGVEVSDGYLDGVNCLRARKVRPNSYVTFYLYTRDHPEEQLLDMKHPAAVRKAKFTEGTLVKILIHGYTKNHDLSPNAEIRPAYLSHGKYNVISVDYAPLVKDGCYITSVENLPIVANCTAQLIDFLVTEVHIPLELIHVIGFSLGAQVAGQISNYVTVGNLFRITGLDPALPLFFAGWNLRNRLDAGDAQFVDVMHTNGGVKGKIEPSGHVDFYMNGGSVQPGCYLKNYSCHHHRAPAYYAESIRNESVFWGYKCLKQVYSLFNFCNGVEADSNYTIPVGEFTPRSARGIYVVKTNDKPPYALGK